MVASGTAVYFWGTTKVRIQHDQGIIELTLAAESADECCQTGIESGQNGLQIAFLICMGIKATNPHVNRRNKIVPQKFLGKRKRSAILISPASHAV
jgi:hypothetical protein